MFQGNAAHTGYVPVTVNPDKFSTRWTLPAVSGLATSYSYGLPAAPTTASGQLFVAGGNFLYARKEFDGSLVWQYDFSGLQFPSVNPPAAADGAVYIAAGQQTSTLLFALNTADGTLRFKTPMSSQWEHYLAPTIGPDGIYTNAGTYGGLFAFDQTGQQLFFDGMAQTSMWTPAVDVYEDAEALRKMMEDAVGAACREIFRNGRYYDAVRMSVLSDEYYGSLKQVFDAEISNPPELAK